MEKNKKKIVFVSVSRSDFGIMKNIIQKSSLMKNFKTCLVITGTHFSKKFGNTIKDISKEKFIKKIDRVKKIKINYSNQNQNKTNIYSSKIFKMMNNLKIGKNLDFYISKLINKFLWKKY